MHPWDRRKSTGKKVAHRMLMKGSISLTCLPKAFTCSDLKCIKIQWSHQYLFALLGPARIKAAQLMKLTPWVNFINVLRPSFLYESKLSRFSLITFSFAIFRGNNICTKCARKMLMKLTPCLRIRWLPEWWSKSRRPSASASSPNRRMRMHPCTWRRWWAR